MYYSNKELFFGGFSPNPGVVHVQQRLSSANHGMAFTPYCRTVTDLT